MIEYARVLETAAMNKTPAPTREPEHTSRNPFRNKWSQQQYCEFFPFPDCRVWSGVECGV